MDAVNNEKVEIRGIEYEKYTDEDGLICLKMYDERSKMWSIQRFSNENKNPNLRENILSILKGSKI